MVAAGAEAAGGCVAGAVFGAGTGGAGIGAGAAGTTAFGAGLAVAAGVAAGAFATTPLVAAAMPSSSVWQMVNIAGKFAISKTSLTTALGAASTTLPPVRPTRRAVESNTRRAALLMKLIPAISITNDLPPPFNHASTSVSNLAEVVPSSRPCTVRTEHSPRFSFVSCIGVRLRNQWKTNFSSAQSSGNNSAPWTSRM